MKNKLYVMRDPIYSEGLKNLISYINETKETKNMTMIEIGSYAGESTEIFANNFKNVVSIDPFLNDYDVNDITCKYMDLNEVYNHFNLILNKYQNIKHIRKTSDDAISELNNLKVDFIYIDGLHTYEQIKKDMQNYIPLINEGGFIGGHDYHPTWEGVVNGINEILGKPEKTFSDTSWIKEIKKIM